MNSIDHTLGSEPVRTSVRFPLRLAITLHTDDRSYEAMTEDVSANGVLFVAAELPPVDANVKFRITMPAAVMGGANDVVIHCSGRIVRRIEGNGLTKAAAVIDEYSMKAEHP